MSQVDDIQFLPTYGAFEKYDPEGGVDSLLGQLPPRLRRNASVHEDFIDFHETVKSSMEVGRPGADSFCWSRQYRPLGSCNGGNVRRVGEIASVRFNFICRIKYPLNVV